MSTLRSTVAAAALILAGVSGAMANPVLEPATQKFIDSLAFTPVVIS
jgi:acetyl esterase